MRGFPYMDSLIPVPQKINEGPSSWPIYLSVFVRDFFVNLRHRHRAAVCSGPPLLLGGDTSWGRQHRPSHQGVLPGEVGSPSTRCCGSPPSSPRSVNLPPGCLSSRLRCRLRGEGVVGLQGALSTSLLSLSMWGRTPEFLGTEIKLRGQDQRAEASRKVTA